MEEKQENYGEEIASELLADNLASGTYYIVLARGGEARICIDLPSQDADDNEGHVQKMNPNGTKYQQWVFTPDPNRPGAWKINCNLGLEKYLQVNDTNDLGAEIRFNRLHSGAYQSWRLIHRGGNNYIIYNDGSGLYLDWKTDDDDRVQQWERHGNEWQIWTLQPA